MSTTKQALNKQVAAILERYVVDTELTPTPDEQWLIDKSLMAAFHGLVGELDRLAKRVAALERRLNQ